MSIPAQEQPATEKVQLPDAQLESSESAEEVDWKAKFEEASKHSREWEKRAKANKDARDRLDKIEAEQMTEADKVKAAEQRAAEAEARADRRDVALRFGLSKEDAELLDDLSSVEAMERMAARLSTAAADERKRGARVPDAGKTPSNDGLDERRAFVRQLTGRN